MAGDKKSGRFTREKLTAPEMDFSAAPKFIRKPLQWIRNYWYYYKMYVVFAVPILLVAVVLIVSAATKKTYDFTVILSGSTTFDSETLDKVCENLSPYLCDVTGDGKLLVGGSDLTIRENLEDEFYANNYNKLAQIMVFDEVVFFLADKYSYAYLEEHGFIEPFSVLGAGSADENALIVNDLLHAVCLKLCKEIRDLLRRIYSACAKRKEVLGSYVCKRSELVLYVLGIEGEAEDRDLVSIAVVILELGLEVCALALLRRKQCYVAETVGPRHVVISLGSELNLADLVKVVVNALYTEIKQCEQIRICVEQVKEHHSSVRVLGSCRDSHHSAL